MYRGIVEVCDLLYLKTYVIRIAYTVILFREAEIGNHNDHVDLLCA